MAVLVGGALGGGARLGVAAAVPAADGIPIGTLLANVTGALLLGYLLARLHGRPDTGLIRPLLATGLLGGYTTFSTFALETWELVEAGRATAGAGYAVLSLTLGVAAAAVGVAAARQRA